MKIRLATKEDCHTLMQFIGAKAEFDRSMKGFDGEISTNIEKIEMTMFGERPFAEALLFEGHGQTQGFALYHFRYSSFQGAPSIWLDDLYVVSEYRSNGVGEALMKAVKERSEVLGCTHLAWTASPINYKAHAFYERIGAEVDRMEGERPFYRW
ncbi:GNAT family N-acetyltransferase [Vibrio sonorensis]|uniref:GNAT family N-acetyltransferase n=1 Tax=Vibrio sonorensis TaxID=1004316 RepID=UPI0008D9E0E4|nr:GNAT family N-acetyltransferase [Vibrio sonorensis]